MNGKLTSSAHPGDVGGPDCQCQPDYLVSEEKVDVLIGLYFKSMPADDTILNLDFDTKKEIMTLVCQRMSYEGITMNLNPYTYHFNAHLLVFHTRFLITTTTRFLTLPPLLLTLTVYLQAICQGQEPHWIHCSGWYPGPWIACINAWSSKMFSQVHHNPSTITYRILTSCYHVLIQF